MSDARSRYLELLYRAIGEPIGLLLRTNEPAKLRERLYAARYSANDPDLAQLQFRLCELGGGNLLICKSYLLTEGGVPVGGVPKLEGLGL